VVRVLQVDDENLLELLGTILERGPGKSEALRIVNASDSLGRLRGVDRVVGDQTMRVVWLDFLKRPS